MRTLLLSALVLTSLAGCAYRRHTTPLNVVSNAHVKSAQRPRGMYSVRLLDATIPQRKVSGLEWDDDGSPPDPFVRLYVDDRLVWESAVIEDTIHPEWDVTIPRNVLVSSSSSFRIEVWDKDTAVSFDPVGRIERQGLPATAQPGAISRLTLDSGTILSLRVDEPVPHRGVGLTVELRPDGLKVIEVEPFSPAGRAGIKQGERIVGIGPERVAHMSDDDAATELSLATERDHKLTVADVSGQEREVTLDDGYTWLVM
ncbi:MAG: PDZ domain-containing protein [Myxococcales bacterium]|jgi:hypothetical protein